VNVVITGSSKGIGFGLAKAFVELGHNVVVSSRNDDAVQTAVGKLSELGKGRVAGKSCDVADYDDVQSLWQFAKDKLGNVDIWINNAGITNRRANLVDLSATEIPRVINTNLIGLINGNKVAITGMTEQNGGKIFNMEGFGADGMVQPGMSIYGVTKRAVRYFNKAMASEYKDSGLIICTVDPGIVVTDFLTKDLYDAESAEFEKRKKFLNLLGDHVEDVAPGLVSKMIAANKNGSAVRWLSPLQVLVRFVKSFFVKRDLFQAGQLRSA